MIFFIVTSLILLVTPGPAVLYIVTQSIDRGRMTGLVSSFGLSFGNIFQVVAAAYGISALLMSSTIAFHILKYLGAAYLVYLGLRKLLTKEDSIQSEIGNQQSLRTIFVQGVLVNLLNPKTAIFFFAYLPQFIDLSKGSFSGQIMMLGTIFIILGMFIGAIFALLAGTLGNWLKRNRMFLIIQRYLTGIVFIALGLTAALSVSSKK